ncbi:MAG: GNAT family N-acetyltransferase [bacterium]
MTASVRKAFPADSGAIAALHLAGIPWGLLTSMGPAFVSAFYRTLLGCEVGFGFLAEREGRPVGYATGVVHWRRFYRTFLIRNWRLATAVLIRQAFRLGRWRRLVETTRYAAASPLPDAELVSIAVDHASRGMGTADILVRQVLAEFARRGVGRVRVSTASSNAGASRLYLRSGFRFLGETQIHRGESAHIYVIDIPAQQ